MCVHKYKASEGHKCMSKDDETVEISCTCCVHIYIVDLITLLVLVMFKVVNLLSRVQTSMISMFVLALCMAEPFIYPFVALILRS